MLPRQAAPPRRLENTPAALWFVSRPSAIAGFSVDTWANLLHSSIRASVNLNAISSVHKPEHPRPLILAELVNPLTCAATNARYQEKRGCGRTNGTAMATMISALGIAGVLLTFSWFSARQTVKMSELLEEDGQL